MAFARFFKSIFSSTPPAKTPAQIEAENKARLLEFKDQQRQEEDATYVAAREKRKQHIKNLDREIIVLTQQNRDRSALLTVTLFNINPDFRDPISIICAYAINLEDITLREKLKSISEIAQEFDELAIDQTPMVCID